MSEAVKSAGSWTDEEAAANLEARAMFIDEWLEKHPDDKHGAMWSKTLAVLLDSGAVHLNRFWWKEEWPEEARQMMGLFVNCNDIFAWGCADSEDMLFADLYDVYRHWRKDPSWGAAVWCMKRRKEMPQEPVAKYIRDGGVWDIDNMGLPENRYDRSLREHPFKKSVASDEVEEPVRSAEGAEPQP